MSDLVKVEQQAGVCTITISRPEKKNALTNDMYGALANAIEGAERDEAIRVLLIRGQTDFTAGNDLGDFAGLSRGDLSSERQSTRFLHALARSSRPIVAAVRGRAVGVGTTMLLHCDMVILGEDALLSTPFVNLALVPEAASSLLMPLRIGYARAFELFALGDALDARSAHAWGLANKVVPNDALYDEALDLARRLATRPAGSLSAMKRLMRDPETLLAQMKAENARFGERLQTAEAREAFTAFAERRPADFTKLVG